MVNETLERALRGSLLLTFVLLATGCAKTTSEKGVVLHDLDSVTPCCNHYSELDFVRLDSSSAEFSIDETSQLFNFSTGKSFVLAVDISSFKNVNKVMVTSTIQDTAFYPMVELLNENYQEIAMSNDTNTELVHSSSFSNGYYRVNLDEVNESATYLLVYTPLSKLNRTTPRIKYSSTLAELGQTRANIDRLVTDSTSFSAVGNLAVKVETDTSDKGDGETLEVSSINTDVAVVKGMSTNDTSPTKVTAIDEYRSQLTLPQIENSGREIIDAVESEQYQRAISLINRAPNPNIARKVFTDVINIRNK